MKKSEMFGISMETDDRSEDDRRRQRAANNHGLLSALVSGAEDQPLDSNFEREIVDAPPALRLNTNFFREIQGLDQSRNQADSQRFNIDGLFEAVASGDVSQLQGLDQYFRTNQKKLTDPLYQSYGKTALMKALLHLRDGRNEAVEMLLGIAEKQDCVKEFVNAAYTSPYYQGQTALHIAIERRSLHYVELLLSKGADVHAKAFGSFFKPHDGTYFYFGELPLSLAACTNQPAMVDFLLENQYQSADAQVTDSHGNTVLHALVSANNEDNTEFITSMYDHILRTTYRLHPDVKLEDIENSKKLTPLKMAAKTGKTGIFSHILKREFHEDDAKHLSRKFTEWVYGPVQCSLYDLAAVDSCENRSVTEILIYSNVPNRHAMLEMEPLNRLMDAKWKRFAGGMFFLNFLVYMAYLIIFTIVAYNKKEKNPFPLEHSVGGYTYVSGQLLTLVSNIYFFFRGIFDMKRKRPQLKTLLVDGYYDILFFFQGVLCLVAAGLYVVGWPSYICFTVMCLALSWVNLLYFARGDKHMGIYSVMIQKMILSDILRFLFVYIVFLFGFSAAVVTLLIEPPPKNITRSAKRTRLFAPLDPGEECVKPSYRNIAYTTLQLFKFTIGMGDMEFTEHFDYREVFYLLLIGYIILTYILLLNMLIALMNRTVEKITQESTSIWRLQRAMTILDMEKRIPYRLRRRLRCGLKRNVGNAVKEDHRWCFRVEEVNWNKWNINLGKINEDPGWDRLESPTDARRHGAHRGRSWRGWFRESSRRQQSQESTEMSPLSRTPEERV